MKNWERGDISLHWVPRLVLTREGKKIETKENTQATQTNNDLVIMKSQESLFPPQGLLIIFLAISCKQSYRYWSPQIRSDQSCPTLCDPMNRSTPGLHVHHQLLEFTETHIHRVSDAIQPSHPLSSPSPPAPNSSQNQSLFQWVNSSHEVPKVLEFQL